MYCNKKWCGTYSNHPKSIAQITLLNVSTFYREPDNSSDCASYGPQARRQSQLLHYAYRSAVVYQQFEKSDATKNDFVVNKANLML